MTQDLPPMWEHQLRANRAAEGLPGYAYFFEMGTGKTRAVIERLRALMNERQSYLRILIFAPSLVVPQWKGEWGKYTQYPLGKIHLLQGPGANRLKTLERVGWLRGERQTGIFITNYEAVENEKVFEAMKRWKPDVVVCDESHRLKSNKSKRAKLVYELCNPWDAEKRVALPRPIVYLMTGTPILNDPTDLFMQYRVMLGGWPDKMGGKLITNFHQFQAKYMRDRNSGMPKHVHFPKWEPASKEKDGWDSMGEIQTILGETSTRVTKLEALPDLPDEVMVRHVVKMLPEQKKVYEELENQFITYIHNRTCAADFAITRLLRCLQVTSGYVPTVQAFPGEEAGAPPPPAAATSLKADPDGVVRFPMTPKDEMLKYLVEEICPTSKVLIWASFRENYRRIAAILQELKIGYVEIHGDTTLADRVEGIQRLSEDDTVRAVIGNAGSGGVGLNMTAAPYSIFYSRDFSLEKFLQARARNHRGGQKHKVTHYDLVSEGTIDEIALDKLAAKVQISEQLLGDVARQMEKQRRER